MVFLVAASVDDYTYANKSAGSVELFTRLKHQKTSLICSPYLQTAIPALVIGLSLWLNYTTLCNIPTNSHGLIGTSMLSTSSTWRRTGRFRQQAKAL